MDEADKLCDRVAVLHAGRIRAIGFKHLEHHDDCVAHQLWGRGFFDICSGSGEASMKTRERFMALGSCWTDADFLRENAIYPIGLMPGWLRAISLLNR